jgi:hypothetical protein
VRAGVERWSREKRREERAQSLLLFSPSPSSRHKTHKPDGKPPTRARTRTHDLKPRKGVALAEFDQRPPLSLSAHVLEPKAELSTTEHLPPRPPPTMAGAEEYDQKAMVVSDPKRRARAHGDGGGARTAGGQANLFPRARHRRRRSRPLAPLPPAAHGQNKKPRNPRSPQTHNPNRTTSSSASSLSSRTRMQVCRTHAGAGGPPCSTISTCRATPPQSAASC